MSMTMHHDGQPLVSRGTSYGLLNQVGYLRQVGSVSMQVTMQIPMVGSKGYESPYVQGHVSDRAGRLEVDDHLDAGNHCIATSDPRPWRKQLNLYLAYASFYNPLNLARALAAWRDPLWSYRVIYQILGILGLVRSLWRDKQWFWNLARGPLVKMRGVPKQGLEMAPPADPGLADRPVS